MGGAVAPTPRGRGIIMIHNRGAVAPTPEGREEGDNYTRHDTYLSEHEIMCFLVTLIKFIEA